MLKESLVEYRQLYDEVLLGVKFSRSFSTSSATVPRRCGPERVVAGHCVSCCGLGRMTLWFTVEIEDNGPGMDEATRKRVFEPFFTTKPPGSGTGLGLSVSYFSITEDYGGMMAVESSSGVGTRFIIRLPAAKDAV